MSGATATITLTDFLHVLHPPDSEGFIDLRALPSKAQAFIRPGDIEAAERFIRAHADENLYFGPATRKTRDSGKLENCGALNDLFSDIDFKLTPEPEAMAKLEGFLLKPSIVVRSGGGLHCYWLLREPFDLQDFEDRKRAKNLLRRLALELGGDLSSAEPAHVLRVPGTLNHKPEYGTPRPVVIERFSPDLQYNPSDFDDLLPKEPEATTNGNGQRFTLPDEIAEGDPGRNNMLYRFGRKLRCAGLTEGEITDALIVANQARCRPPLPQEHVREIAHHVVTQPNRPDFAATGNSNGDPLDPLRALADSPTPAEIEAELRIVVTSLAGADGLRRVSLRQEALSVLNTKKVNGAAKLVDAAWALVGGSTDEGKSAAFLVDPEPWSEPVDGTALLDSISTVLRRYMVMTKEQADTAALWVLFAHSHDAFQVSPILAVQSPVMGCGKSRLQAILTPMLPHALAVCNLGAATLFRTVEKYKPTLLIDEADTFMRENEGLRGIVNSGWLRSGAQTIRLVGDDHETRTFSTWCPKVIAAIGKLPLTIQDRSIVIELKRKTEGEMVKRFGIREANELKPLCSKAARWATDNIDTLREATPDPLTHLGDRQADSWTPLLAIADLAGGDWPDRARKAAETLSGGERDPEADDAGVMLIADCVAAFKERKADRLSTSDLIAELVKIEGRPWPEWSKGKPITPRGLAKLLKPFGIKPKVERAGDDQFRGYEAHAFTDAFSRYSQGSNAYHPYQSNEYNDLDPNFNVYQTPDGTDTERELSIEKQRNGTHGTDRHSENSRNENVEQEFDITDPGFETQCAADMGDLFDSEEVAIL
jgi:hypothetical protein